MLCSLFIWPSGAMQAVYIFSVLLSTGNSPPLDCEDFSKYNLLLSRCVKIQLSLNSKYADFVFGFLCCWSSWISVICEKCFGYPLLCSERSKISLIQTSEWFMPFFFFFSKHLIFKNEISPYDVTLKLYFMDSFPSRKVYFWNLSHVCVTCFFIKTFRKCPYLLKSLTSRIGLKQNSSSRPTQPTNLDGFFFSVKLS